MKSYPAALAFLLRNAGNEHGTGLAYVGERAFRFRKLDASALQEILVEREYDFLLPALRDCGDGYVLDVGAHIGLFALTAFTVNPRLHVISVEPSPETFALLQENRDRHPDLAGRWTLLHRAAWRDDTELRFADEGASVGHRLAESGRRTVRGIGLEELLDQVPARAPVSVLKVDIEGAEDDFLCTGAGLPERVRRLVIELHPRKGPAERVERLCREEFPSVALVSGRSSSQPLLYCTRTLQNLGKIPAA
jgi:FkbM family methyltransferase